MLKWYIDHTKKIPKNKIKNMFGFTGKECRYDTHSHEDNDARM